MTATALAARDAAIERPAFDRPLRIGVMLDSFHAPRWIEKVLRDIVTAPFLDLSLVVVDGTSQRAPARGSGWREWLRRQRAALPYRLWEWYVQADRRRFRSEGPDPFETTDVAALVKGADIVRVEPIRAKFVDRFSDEDIERIKAADLDVILRFGFRVIKGGILSSARFGVWSLHHGDNRAYRGGPALFWEIYERNPESGTVLQVLTEALDGGRVIYRTIGATNFASLHKNRLAAYWKSAELITRRLGDLWREGWPYLESLDTYREQIAYDRGIYRRPTNTQMLRFLARTYAYRPRATLLQNVERWAIGFRPRQDPHAAFTIVYPPAGRFFADPFVADDGGRSFVVFEDYSERTAKGSISSFEIRRDGTPGDVEPVLERDYHLSYPFLFRWRGEWWMVPESGNRGTVELYRARDFPRGWTMEAVLLEGMDARDATLLEHDGRWWMFVTVCVVGGPRSDELSLFVADTPFGPWRPHPRNPIVSNVRRARSAGAIFRDDNALVRPAQDCSRGYGHAITLNRIDRLTEREYRETVVGEIGPTWHPGVRATHTLNRSERYEVRDGRWFRWRRS